MEIAKDIGVEKGKWFENLHLFAFWCEFVELATFQLLILCTLLSSLKFSRLFYHLIVLTSQLTFWKLLLSRSFVCCVKCVCSFALCEKPHGFFLLTNFQGCWDFQKKKHLSKPCWKFHQVPYLMCCVHSFIHACEKLRWLPNLLHIVLLKAFKVFPLLFVHYSHSLIACITLVMDFVENLVDLQAWENNFFYILRST